MNISVNSYDIETVPTTDSSPDTTSELDPFLPWRPTQPECFDICLTKAFGYELLTLIRIKDKRFSSFL